MENANANRYKVRPGRREEWQEALGLAWRTFLKFESKDYSEEGIRNFREFLADSALYRMFLIGTYHFFVALDGTQIVGIITLREDNHISLLFVDEAYHYKGIGRKLVECMQVWLKMHEKEHRLTVNAAPYGVEFYHRVGFLDSGPEREERGIRYTPMVLHF